MPHYDVNLNIAGVMSVYARNADEAVQIALEDTLHGIGTAVEISYTMIYIADIEVEQANKTDNVEETFQCPNCDAWGFDTIKEYCKVCDAEEEE